MKLKDAFNKSRLLESDFESRVSDIITSNNINPNRYMTNKVSNELYWPLLVVNYYNDRYTASGGSIETGEPELAKIAKEAEIFLNRIGFFIENPNKKDPMKYIVKNEDAYTNASFKKAAIWMQKNNM